MSNVRVHLAQALRKQYVVRQIRQAHVLIIDEVSMMGPDLLEVSRTLKSESDYSYSCFFALFLRFANLISSLI